MREWLAGRFETESPPARSEMQPGRGFQDFRPTEMPTVWAFRGSKGRVRPI